VSDDSCRLRFPLPPCLPCLPCPCCLHSSQSSGSIINQHDPNPNPRYQAQLQTASTSLLHHLRPSPVAQITSLLQSADAANDPGTLVAILLLGAHSFMRAATGRCMSARLALLSGDGGAEALLCELPHGALETGDGSFDRRVAAPFSTAADLDVTATRVVLQHTLLAAALDLGEARFISDAAKWVRSHQHAARAQDVFTRTSEAVASIVVLPVFTEVGTAAGGIYFSADTPCGFQEMQDTLLVRCWC